MTQQSNFMILAAIDLQRISELRRLLSSMNRGPGVVNPSNPLVPLGQLEKIHFARFVILEDGTLDDNKVYGLPRVDYPTYLAFLGDFDGPAEAFFAELVQRGDGLGRIFSHCESFTPNADLLGWMKARNVTPATIYVNWIGRSTQQVREEEALRQSMEAFIQANSASLGAMPPRQARDTLKKFVAGR